MTAEIKLRQATFDDATDYVRIETEAYRPEFLESAEAFRAKVRAFPAGCWFATVREVPVAYLICHPWNDMKPPPLNPKAFCLPDRPTLLFLHSLTIVPRWQRRGVGNRLARHALELGTALGFSTVALVSVQNSETFWTSQGFTAVENLPQSVAAGLKCYGQDARYMVRRC